MNPEISDFPDTLDAERGAAERAHDLDGAPPDADDAPVLGADLVDLRFAVARLHAHLR